MGNSIAIPMHEIPDEVLEKLKTTIEQAVSSKVAVRVKGVTVESFVDENEDLIIKVTIHIERYPQERGWMHDIITTATGAIRNSGVRGKPFIDAYA